MRTTDPAIVWLKDPDCLAEVHRIAAAAACPVEDVFGAEGGAPGQIPPLLRRRWGSAPCVLLDPETASACSTAELPKRSGIVIVQSADAEEAPENWRELVKLGVSEVCQLPGCERKLVDALSRSGEAATRSGRVIAVTGARGGAGVSTFAAALALTSASRTLLVDTDDDGPGLDLTLGAEQSEGLRWPDLRGLTGRVSAEALWSALPSVDSVSVLSHARMTSPGLEREGVTASALRAVADAAKADGALCVVDLPRLRSEAGDACRDIADLIVMVTPAEIRACAAARSRGALLRDCPSGLVVRGPSPGGLSAHDVARATGLELLASLRAESALAARLERGGLRLSKRSPIQQAAQKVLHRADAA
ncbi:hypothetical protein ONR57_05350 [Hoyosella sp. YIM 151337]|uniref:septum site-determining protein Ssd n=1 Tax=Hoyosella sp. YIM 151337 TaxID=2992742 RepID=UPI0022362B6D|nr:septum site-determining protein Ssd [Hoyosella sp. YIM 151337]MCW4352721.1 hypothetical protein [Hoyosella sp. YIM 151337]